MQLRRAALRRAIKIVAAGDVDLEGDRLRRADHGAVDEDRLIEAIEREAVARAEAVVRRGVFDRDDLSGLDVDFRRLVLPRVLAQLDDARRRSDAFHAARNLPLLIPAAGSGEAHEVRDEV